MLGFQAEGAAPLVLGHPVDDPQTVATAIRIGRPASGGAGAARPRRVGRRDRRGHRRRDPRRVPRPGPLRGHLLRARQRRVGGGRAQARGRGPHRPGRDDRCVLTGPRPQGSGHGGRAASSPALEAEPTRGGRAQRARLVSGAAPGRGSRLVERSVTVEVPATTANLGAGFDALALALDIVNTRPRSRSSSVGPAAGPRARSRARAPTGSRPTGRTASSRARGALREPA